MNEFHTPFTVTSLFFTLKHHKLNGGLDELLGLEEALEVAHLPRAHHDEDAGLGEGPPQNPLIRALARLAEPLLAVLKVK